MEDHWFEQLADHMGPAYLRYSFTKGTEQEVVFLVDALALSPGMRVLDVGCGPGRHALALARRGLDVVGVDISRGFVELATSTARAEGLTARFERMDARELIFDEEFDVAISLCQGGFGLVGRVEDGEADGTVLAGASRALKPAGQLAISAFSAYFMLRHLESGDTFDAATGVNHESTEVRDPSGATQPADLWTTCFTPRELRLMVAAAGLVTEQVWSVAPGAYGRNPPSVELPEFLVVARRPS